MSCIKYVKKMISFGSKYNILLIFICFVLIWGCDFGNGEQLTKDIAQIKKEAIGSFNTDFCSKLVSEVEQSDCSDQVYYNMANLLQTEGNCSLIENKNLKKLCTEDIAFFQKNVDKDKCEDYFVEQEKIEICIRNVIDKEQLIEVVENENFDMCKTSIQVQSNQIQCGFQIIKKIAYSTLCLVAGVYLRIRYRERTRKYFNQLPSPKMSK